MGLGLRRSLLLRSDRALDIEAGAAVFGDYRLDMLGLSGGRLYSWSFSLRLGLGWSRLSRGTAQVVEEGSNLGLRHPLAVLSDELLGDLARDAGIGSDGVGVRAFLLL